MTDNKNELKVTKDMLIGDFAQQHPESVGILFEAGMYCIGCGMAGMETLEQGCKGHGMSDEEIDEMMEKINNNINKK